MYFYMFSFQTNKTTVFWDGKSFAILKFWNFEILYALQMIELNFIFKFSEDILFLYIWYIIC